MKRAACGLGAGCVLVGIVALVMLIIGGDWKLFAIVNGALWRSCSSPSSGAR